MTIKWSLSHTVQVPEFARVGEKYGKYTQEALQSVAAEDFF